MPTVTITSEQREDRFVFEVTIANRGNDKDGNPRGDLKETLQILKHEETPYSDFERGMQNLGDLITRLLATE